MSCQLKWTEVVSQSGHVRLFHVPGACLMPLRDTPGVPSKGHVSNKQQAHHSEGAGSLPVEDIRAPWLLSHGDPSFPQKAVAMLKEHHLNCPLMPVIPGGLLVPLQHAGGLLMPSLWRQASRPVRS